MMLLDVIPLYLQIAELVAKIQFVVVDNLAVEVFL